MKASYLSLIILSFLILGCSEFDRNISNKDLSSPSFSVTNTGKACYFSDSSLVAPCLKTIPLVLNEDSMEYIYPDPFEAINFPLTQNPYQYLPPINTIDLLDIEQGFKLSPHFKSVELMSPRKGQHGFFSPNAFYYLNRMRALIKAPLIITSGYRSPVYNEKIGGAQWSRHKYGDAADIVSKSLTVEELAEICKENKGFSITYRNHVHCDWRKEPLHKAFFPQKINPAIKLAIVTQTNYVKIKKLFNKDNQIYYMLEIEIMEDPEPIKVSWKIFSVNKKAVKQSGTGIIFLTDRKASYIEVTIGDTFVEKFYFIF